MDSMIGIIPIIFGMVIIIFSFFIKDRKGMYLFIFGFVMSLFGYMIYPKTPPTPIVLKSKKVVDIDSIYARGFRDGFNECKNK